MLTKDDLKKLAGVCGPCLTIFEPLRDEYSQVTKPDTRVVAAIQEAGRLLEAKGFSAAERDEMLQPLNKIAANTDWKAAKGSLAMFRAPGFTMTEFWPEPLAHRVHFGQEFLVLPLLAGLQGEHDFWLLALTIKAVRLFRGSRKGLVEVALPRGVPRSLAEAGEFGTHRDNRARSSRSRNEAGADYLHDFFTAVERGIRPLLEADRQPLILAGVTRELAIYRKVNTYSPLLSGAIHGSPFDSGADALYRRAAELMVAYSAQDIETKLNKREEEAGRALAITDPAAVIEAAGAGQVDVLILSPAAPGFAQREESINWAALATIRHGGKFALAGGSQPEAGISALLRFRPTEEEESATEMRLPAALHVT